MMYNAAERIQQEFEDKTKALLAARHDAKRFKKLNRERSDIIKRARRCNVALRFTS